MKYGFYLFQHKLPFTNQNAILGHMDAIIQSLAFFVIVDKNFGEGSALANFLAKPPPSSPPPLYQ